MLVVVDYDVGNLASVTNALRKLEIPHQVSQAPNEVRRASALILPGVGAAASAMRKLHGRGLDEALTDATSKGVPLLGICLGMQLLFTSSSEGGAQGLDLLPGTVKRFAATHKVPHIGWNCVWPRGGSLLEDEGYFYFVHSYYCRPTNTGAVVATTDYGMRFCSVVQQQNIFGVQFHPEKSGDAGLRLLRNFWRLT